MGTQTPWGKSDHVEKFAPGVAFYGTPSHGGYHLSASMNAKIPEALRKLGEVRSDRGTLYVGWYEEDVAYNVVLFCFPELFPGKKEAAREVLKNYHPDEYAAATGEVVKPEESRVLRERAAREAAKNKYVGVSAYGTWHKKVPEGFVGVVARRGGRLANGRYASDDEKCFLVPASVYEGGPDVIGFVFEDESKFKVVEGGF